MILEAFKVLVSELGLPLAEEKTEGPATSLIFLEIKLDMMQQTLKLPQNKLKGLKARVNDMLGKKKVMLKES